MFLGWFFITSDMVHLEPSRHLAQDGIHQGNDSDQGQQLRVVVVESAAVDGTAGIDPQRKRTDC